jgi:osmotically-inducible protein OsmY
MRNLGKIGGVLLLMSGLALLSAACSATPEAQAPPSADERANAALKEARLDQVIAVWEQGTGVLHLKGFVPGTNEKRQAEEVVAGIVGPDQQIVNDIAVTLRGAPAPAPVVVASEDLRLIDERVHRDIELLFADKSVWAGREIEVGVRQGQVRLTGQVLSQEEKDRITEMVARVTGVTEVVNRLDIKEVKEPVRNPAGPGRLL